MDVTKLYKTYKNTHPYPKWQEKKAKETGEKEGKKEKKG